ncbi:MAG: peptidase C11 [Lachnospiraceae bacterium]|nr:peptidase C11 [Lachnospiraceae bacterium]
MQNSGSGRQKHVTSGSGNVYKRGSGLGTGPVGRADGYSGRTGGGSSSGGSKASPVSSILGKKLSPITILIIIAIFIITKGNFLGGSSNYSFSGDNTSSNWSNGSNTGKLNTNVAKEAKAKRTNILGNGKDTITIMLYMCGTDLESKNGMASNDIREILNANLSDKINIILYTGGCKGWKSNNISSDVNQIYKVKDKKLELLVADDGNKAMTDPATLKGFIKYCKDNYPANRNELILWDHGGGSVSGFGYDEKNAGKGSMDLSKINSVLKESGVNFDFIGFDACLMATMETALMCSNYADYLIASEETEPGYGWYYTPWLNALSKNTSMPTIEIGKNIIDSFVDECGRKCPGQKTTLSIIDLAEFSATVPSKLTDFSTETSKAIKNDNYQQISDARANSREFAQSSAIDQVDLISLAYNINSNESKKLAETLLRSIKYNRTSSNMTNAYGVSVYFPLRNTRKVNNIAQINDNIGVDDEYTKCIKAFASMETSGQVASGGNNSPLPSLTGGMSDFAMSVGSDAISSILTSFLAGASVSGVDSSSSGFMTEDGSVSVNDAARYVADHQFDSSKLLWNEKDGKHLLTIDESQWDLIQSLQMNMFFDDGEGYIDLGLDNVYEFNDDGDLIGDSDNTWVAINGQVVAYYFESEIKDDKSSTITGRVPCMLNGDRANLIIVFDDKHKDGYIAGARFDYVDGSTDTIAKGITEIEDGTKIDYLCDYYSYAGEYQDSYYLGEQTTYNSSMKISNVDVGQTGMITYLLTDIYNQEYWTPVVPSK